MFRSIRARMTSGFVIAIVIVMAMIGLALGWNARRTAENRAQLMLRNAAREVRIQLATGTDARDLARLIAARNTRPAPRRIEADIVVWLQRRSRNRSQRPNENASENASANADENERRSRSARRRPSAPEVDSPSHADSSPRADSPLSPSRRTLLAERWLRHENGEPFGVGEILEITSGGTRIIQGELPIRKDSTAWRTDDFYAGPLEVTVGLPWERVERVLNEQARNLWLLCLAVTIAAGLGAWALVGRTLSPIHRLSGQARQIAHSATVHNAPKLTLQAPSPDAEMRELVGTLNELLSAVGAAARAQEQFHTAASHELRTPLQALSGHLQVALSRPRDAETYRQTLEEARVQTQRLTDLVRDLLTLNQLHAASAQPPRETLDLVEVCDLALSPLQKNIDARGLSLQVLAPDNALEINCAPTHVEMLARNLLENAVKYAAANSEIKVELQDQAPQLQVWNATENAVESEPIEKWLQPFYRPDAARHSQTGGNGLGLAICQAICEANHWQLALSHVANGVQVAVSMNQNAKQSSASTCR